MAGFFLAAVSGKRSVGIPQHPGKQSLLTIAATILLGQIAIVQWGGEMFRTVPLAWQHGLVILVATSLVLVAAKRVRWRNRCKGLAVGFG